MWRWSGSGGSVEPPTLISSITVGFDSLRLCSVSLICHFWWKILCTWLCCICKLFIVCEKLHHLQHGFALICSGFFVLFCFHFQTQETSLEVFVFHTDFFRFNALPSWHSHNLSSPFLLSLGSKTVKTTNAVEGLNWTLQLSFHLIYFFVFLWIGFDIVSLLSDLMPQ